MSEPTTPLAPIALQRVPRATVRLQLHRDFTFDHVRALLDDFAALGISHLYTSPITTAQPGSTHGYDVVDPTRVNPELGGEPALERLVEALHARGMGLVVDIVPNHMGVGGAHNAWWLDVLESGPESAYANFFDIDWQPSHPGLRNKVLAPFLGENYADALAGGRLQLAYEEAAARLAIAYYDHRFPIALADYPALLRTGNTDTATHAVADRFAGLGTIRSVRTRRERADEARDALRNLATTEAGAAGAPALAPCPLAHRQ